MKTLQYTLLTIIAGLCIMFGYACSTSDDGPGIPPSTPNPGRTILVYMAANNNLSNYALLDIAEMKRGAADGQDFNSGRLIVYHAAPGVRPRLFEINPDGTETPIAVYDNTETSVSIERMRRVIADTKAAAPAPAYGIVLWSHATGWLNDTGVIDEPAPATAASPLSFGADGHPAKKMKISSLARALEGTDWDFIYFDCCHMATVEVAYELRHVTDRIAASVTELEVEGMPYHLNLGNLFADTPDLKKAIRNTFDYYNTPGKDYEGCSITLIDASQLDGLAKATKAIMQSDAALPDGYRPVPCFRSIVMDTDIFDMYHYITHLDTESRLIKDWEETFGKVVIAHHSTPRVYGLDTKDFHGLGCNIVNAIEDADTYGYRECAWWRDVVSTRFDQQPEP